MMKCYDVTTDKYAPYLKLFLLSFFSISFMFCLTPTPRTFISFYSYGSILVGSNIIIVLGSNLLLLRHKKPLKVLFLFLFFFKEKRSCKFNVLINRIPNYWALSFNCVFSILGISRIDMKVGGLCSAIAITDVRLDSDIFIW